MRMLNMFSRQQIGKDTYVVTENYLPGHRCVCGVVVGAERVLVIDTGLGMAGDLRRYVESFVGTVKPIFCICTHGHTDCIGGASLFDEAYLKHEDVGPIDPEFHLRQMKGWTLEADGIEEHARLTMPDMKNVTFGDLHEGDHFHLGGVHVGIFCLPGHTPGSVAVRVTREGVQTFSFVGDAFSADLNHLTNMNREQLIDYAGVLMNFQRKLNNDEPCFSSHNPIPIKRDVALDVAMCCRQVAHGNIKNDPSYVMFKKRPDGPDFRVHFSNNSYIVYNADLL